MEGKLNPNLGLHRLTVGPNGKVCASIRAGEVEILGVVERDIEVTNKIVIRRNARLTGNLKMAGILIEESIDITTATTAGAVTQTV